MHCSIVYILVQKYNIMMEKYTLLRLLQIWSTNCCLMMHISRYRVRGNCICTVYIKLTQCTAVQQLHQPALFVCKVTALQCTVYIWRHSGRWKPALRIRPIQITGPGKKMQLKNAGGACMPSIFAQVRMLALRKPIQVPVVFCRHSADRSGQMASWLSWKRGGWGKAWRKTGRGGYAAIPQNQV